MVAAKLSGLAVNVSFIPAYAIFHWKVERVWSASLLSGARKQDGLNLNFMRSQSEALQQRRGGHNLVHARLWKKRDHGLGATAYSLHAAFERVGGSRISAWRDDPVDAHAAAELETWQLRKLAAAAELGPDCVNVEALAAQVGVSVGEVLAWLEAYTQDHPAPDDETGAYMEDVNIIEEMEEHAEHVPAPATSERDMDMQTKVEDLMYTLKDVLPGCLADTFADEKRWKAMAEHFSENVDFQNPLFCLRGRSRVLKWMQSLAQARVFLNLHDLFYENIFTNKSQRWVTAVWTVSSASEERLSDSHSGSALGDNHDLEISMTPRFKGVFEMSGETNFEMDEAGLVTNVCTRWYRTAKATEENFMKSKIWLAEFLLANFSEALT